ncbi:MAG: hypothetical protein JSW63_03180, partial [Ignavibacterium sp.]
DSFKKIANEIKQTKKISFEDVKKLITQAVSFNANYIVRPKWSITKLIYNDKETVGADELELILNYIYYYDYIKKVLTAYIIKRGVDQFSVTDFDLILNKIDRELFKEDSEQIINNTLVTMGDFFNIGGIEKNLVPLNGVEILLKEKNLIDYVLKLNRAFPDDTKKKYEIDDIKNILYAKAPAAGAAVEEKADEERTVEVAERDEVDIATEETVSTLKPVSDVSDMDEDKIEEIVEDETGTDEELPIEKEFESDFNPKPLKISDPLANSEPTEEIEEIKIEDEPESFPQSELKEIPEKETIAEEIVSDSEQIVTDDKQESIAQEPADVNDINGSNVDELIDFYEKELAMMDDKLSDKTIPEEESYKENEELDVKVTEDTVVVPMNNEVKDKKETIDEEKFNLSIFDNEEKKTADEKTSEQEVNAADGMVRTADEIKESADEKSELVSEDKSELTTDEKTEPIAQEETEEETPVEKEIVQQMIDDHDKNEGDEFNKDEQEQEYFDIIDEESSNEQEATITEEFTDETEFLSSFGKTDSPDVDPEMKEDTTDEQDISVVKDEFEKLLEEDEAEESTVKDETEQDKSNGKDSREKEQIIEEEFKFVENIGTKEDSESQFTGVEIPVREKDLLSYLSKKEIKKIISNVFAGDDADFVTSIEKISECGSYDEATEILKGTFFSYRVSPYSKEAVVLTNATSNYFRQV